MRVLLSEPTPTGLEVTVLLEASDLARLGRGTPLPVRACVECPAIRGGLTLILTTRSEPPQIPPAAQAG